MPSASDMAEQLKGIESDYIFFCAYIAKGSEQENVDANVPMLANLLEALAKTGAEKKLKRVILTAGLKQYGVQFGRLKNPMEETDPPLRAHDRPPNFYYNQQDVLAEMSKGKNWDYVVTYPQDVIGVASGNPMNLATSVGLYAAVGKGLFPNSELPFSRQQGMLPRPQLLDQCQTARKILPLGRHGRQGRRSGLQRH
jgi:nucleoside-diphosphate-sugar epimerase